MQMAQVCRAVMHAVHQSHSWFHCNVHTMNSIQHHPFLPNYPLPGVYHAVKDRGGR